MAGGADEGARPKAPVTNCMKGAIIIRIAPEKASQCPRFLTNQRLTRFWSFGRSTPARRSPYFSDLSQVRKALGRAEARIKILSRDLLVMRCEHG